MYNETRGLVNNTVRRKTKMQIPNSLKWFLVQKSTSFTPWHLENEPRGLKNPFKSEDLEGREVYVFAYRQDCDDLAGFLLVDGIITEKVIHFHPSYTSNSDTQKASGWSIVNGEYEDIFEFFAKVVMPDMKEWAITEDADDLLDD